MKKFKSLKELSESQIMVLKKALEPLGEKGWNLILKHPNNRILCNGYVASPNGMT